MTGGKFKTESEELRGSPPVGEASDCSGDKASSSDDSADASSVWIFGYGSLLWKVNFPFHDKVVGYVEGYSRRFWQGSTDHRGIPGAPGRVVTLIQQDQATTWGVAYKVDPSNVMEVIAYLDHREKGGYTTKKLAFHPKQSLNREPFKTLVYIATEANPVYLGPAPLGDIARQIVKCKGPSGCNTEYVLNLAQEMRKIAPGVDDQHLFSLEGHIREILEKSGTDGENAKGCLCQPCDGGDHS